MKEGYLKAFFGRIAMARDNVYEMRQSKFPDYLQYHRIHHKTIRQFRSAQENGIKKWHNDNTLEANKAVDSGMDQSKLVQKHIEVYLNRCDQEEIINKYFKNRSSFIEEACKDIQMELAGNQSQGMRLKVKAEEKGKKGERRCRGSRISRDGKSRVNTFSEKKTTQDKGIILSGNSIDKIQIQRYRINTENTQSNGKLEQICQPKHHRRGDSKSNMEVNHTNRQRNHKRTSMKSQSQHLPRLSQVAHIEPAKPACKYKISKKNLRVYSIAVHPYFGKVIPIRLTEPKVQSKHSVSDNIGLSVSQYQ